MTFSLEMVNKPVRITDSGQQMGGVLAIPVFWSFFFFILFQRLCKNEKYYYIKYNCKQIINLVFTILRFSTASFYIEGLCSSAINVYKAR